MINLEKFKHKSWLDGRIIAINGDCQEVMAEIGDKEIDLVLTDPPYGIGFDHKIREVRITNWDNEIPNRIIFDDLIRVSKKQIIWGGNYFPSLWVKGCRGFIFWKKNNPVPNFSDGELAWTSFNSVARCFNYNYYGNQEGGGVAENKIHPTQNQSPLCLGA